MFTTKSAATTIIPISSKIITTTSNMIPLPPQPESIKVFPSIIQVLLVNMNKSNLSVQLNENEIDFLKELIMNHPETFQEINENLNSILADKKIDIQDIPQIILLISNAYHSISINNIFENVDIINVIQYTIDSMIDSGIIPLPQIELTIIKQVIDSSIKLLRLTLPTIETGINNCFSICCYSPHQKS